MEIACVNHIRYPSGVFLLSQADIHSLHSSRYKQVPSLRIAFRN